jgi:hypothetical protein
MRKVNKVVLSVVAISSIFLTLFTNSVGAQDDVNKLSFFEWEGVLGDPKFLSALIDLSDAAGRVRFIMILVISIFVTLFVGVTLYGAFTWVTAGDSEERLQKAKKIIKSGITGLALSLGFLVSIGIIAFVLGINITEIDLSALESEY